MAMSISLLFASMNVQTVSKKELMCIKGIGEKKAEAVLKYRKSHKLKSADDLINIKGFGKTIIENVKKEIKSVSCGGKKQDKKTKSKKNKELKKKEQTSKKNKELAKKERISKKDKELTKKEQTSKKVTKDIKKKNQKQDEK